MIRIHRVHDCLLKSDKDRIAQVQEIFRCHFPDFGDYDKKIPELLRRPFRYGYRALLLVCERKAAQVAGFSLVLHFPETNFSLLDFLAVAPGIRGGGLGQALYEATREYLIQIASRGLFLEVMPDEPALVADRAALGENRRRMRFYEQFGARPIVNTAYETPFEGVETAPSLLFDPLGRSEPLGVVEARRAVELILRRKYAHIAPPGYIDKVMDSFRDDPVRIRPPRYLTHSQPPPTPPPHRLASPFTMVVSRDHAIHHVHERGYVERPARIEAVLEGLRPTGLFVEVPRKKHGEAPIRRVHDGDYVTYLKRVSDKLSPARPVYPYVFPIRQPQRKPRDLAIRAGYYCIDTFTPLDAKAYLAAREAVDVALTAAEEILAGRKAAYGLCRPPGHHAGRRTFGGFCYFNNAAVAADLLAETGKAALLDLDYHHGNGTQEIFYRRSDVLTLSIHGHPNDAYPFFSGFADETGEGSGLGFNRNYPLGENAAEVDYLAAVDKAVQRIERFRPQFLVVSLGVDTLRGDPTGTFSLTPATLRQIGTRLASLNLPTLVLQEGGYNLRNLRQGPPAFFSGLSELRGK